MEDKLEGAEAVIICKSRGEWTPFTDNQETECVLCGQSLICRPYVDLVKMRPLCFKCGMAAMKQCDDPIDKIVAMPEAHEEFDQIFGEGKTEEALENAKLMLLMAKAFDGQPEGPEGEELFTCELCGETFAKARSDEEALEQLASEYPGVDPKDCGIVCGQCHEKLRGAGL